jgi:hypothetical protein
VAGLDFVLDVDWKLKAQLLTRPAMARAAGIVADGQRRRIPVSREGSYGRAPGYARDRIHVETGRSADGPHWDIGSDATTPDGTSYPLILELGSRPHVIQSHGDYPLRDRHGRVFGREVKHPGTRPYPWCRAALQDLAGKRL